jgi:hypothetical protein
MYVYRGFVGSPEGKIPLRRPRSRWEGNIKIYFREIVQGVYCIHLAQVRDQWQAFVNMAVDQRVP